MEGYPRRRTERRREHTHTLSYQVESSGLTCGLLERNESHGELAVFLKVREDRR